LDLPGEYNVSATFNVSDLSPFDVSDSRTNPFEERGNDGNQQVNDGTRREHDDLHMPSGPITRARAKKIKEAMLGLVRDVFEQEEQEAKMTIKLGLNECQRLVHMVKACEAEDGGPMELN
jgi:hypothetical protein